MAKNTFHTSNATKWAAECSSPSSRPTLPKAQTWTNDYKYVYVSVLHEYLYILSQSHPLNFTSAKQTNDLYFYKIKIKKSTNWTTFNRRLYYGRHAVDTNQNEGDLLNKPRHCHSCIWQPSSLLHHTWLHLPNLPVTLYCYSMLSH